MYVYNCLTLLMLLGSCHAGFNMKAPSAAAQAQVIGCEDALFNSFCNFKTLTETGDCAGATQLLQNIQATSCAPPSPITPLRIFRGLQYARQFAQACPNMDFPSEDCTPAVCTNRVFNRGGDRFKCSIRLRNRARQCYNQERRNGCSFAESLSNSVLNVVRPELCGNRNRGSVSIPGDPQIVPAC